MTVVKEAAVGRKDCERVSNCRIKVSQWGYFGFSGQLYLVSDDIPIVPTVHFVIYIPAAGAEGGVRGNEPGRSKARRPVTFECGSPLLHIATLADASQEASSAGLETWIRGRNNGWLTIARRTAH